MRNSFEIIDAHCHIYPASIAAKAAAATAEFYGFPQKERDGTVETLFSLGDPAGIDRYVVQSVATSPKQVGSINRFIAKTVASEPGRLIGLGTLHPDSRTPEEDVSELISLGLHGVKIHPDIQGISVDDPRWTRIYEICAERDLPMLMHTGDIRYDFSNPNRLIPILRSFPALRVIGAHFGGYSLGESASLALAGIPNLYVDCSSAARFMDDETAVRVIRRYGADRVMFGSDYPLWSPDGDVERFFRLPLTDQERKMILSENAKRIYSIEK